MDQLQKGLRIEEETRIRDGRGKQIVSGYNPKVNYIDSIRPDGGGKKRKYTESVSNTNKDSNSKKNKTCFHCKKKGHFKKECRFWKKMKKDHASSSNKVNVAEEEIKELVAMVSEMQISMVTEVHMAAIIKSQDWWFDSGATVHICNEKNMFKDYEVAEKGHEVLMGNSNAANVHGKGTIEIFFTSGKKLTLINVLHVPKIRKNLVSTNLLCKKGIKAVLESDKLILSKNGVFVGKGYACDGMFKLSANIINNNKDVVSAYIIDSSISLWHARLAHVNYRSLKFMAKHGYINYQDAEYDKCETCIQAKMTKLPFPKADRHTELLQLIHSDVCELNGILTRGGNRYLVTFIDDHSRYTYVYLMKNKNEVFDKFKYYKSLVENQKGKKILALRSDRGGEYFPTEFVSFCEQHGIIHETRAPYTPQQNGLAERKNRTLVDMVNSMILIAKLPNNLWGEALLSACHIHNRIPSRKAKVSPYELWNGRKPNLNYIKVWGCLAFYRVTDPQRTKLGFRALKSVFVGYAENSKAYRLLDLDSNVIVESRDVHFIENKFRHDSTYELEPTQTQIRDNLGMNFSSNLGLSLNSNVGSTSIDKSSQTQEQVDLRRSQRVRKEKNLDSDFISSQAIVFLVEGDRKNVTNKISIVLSIENDPKSFSEAMTSRDVAF